jgi:methylmalonyl-CoA mutase
MVELSLARDFPPVDEAAWKALVEEALKGAPFASLRSSTYDGIPIEPLYSRAKYEQIIAARAPGQSWQVMQRVDLPSAEAANTQALDDLANGANGLTLVFEGSVGDYGYALPSTGAAISQALDNVYLDAGIAIDLDLSRASGSASVLWAP